MIRLRQIKINIENDNIKEIKNKVAKKLHMKVDDIKSINISKKSIDARNKNNILYVYEIDVLVSNEKKVLNKNYSKDIFLTPNEEYKYVLNKDNSKKPIIIGSGPAGLFCAYLLAEAGYKPLIIERGEKVEDRVKTVEKFWNDNILNENSNVQFGEGGAGTFSDGKLNTLIKDKDFRMKKVFEIFVSCGAPKEILYIHNPHIGTDLLRKVVINLRNKIINMGGVFRYNTCLTNIGIENNKLVSITLNKNEIIKCDTLVLAIGHSSRDTFKMIYEKGIEMKSKPFAIGVRIVHSQDLINKNQYGINYKKMGSASYKLTYMTKSGRGVYSFCMCPGGYVVNSSSEKNKLVINGMSNYKRDSGYANSAIVVSVNNKDYGNNIFDGMKYQENLETSAFFLENGSIPVQKYTDFKNNKLSELTSEYSFIKGKYSSSNLSNLFSNEVKKDLIEAIDYFNKKIPGFSSKDALVLGIETRTSSPVRIIRNDDLMSNIKGIYPCGEGAGYAGGITTSAIDGIKVAEKIGNAYPKKD